MKNMSVPHENVLVHINFLNQEKYYLLSDY